MPTASAVPPGRLRLSKRLAIESVSEEALVVFHPDRLTRLRLTLPLYHFMLRFSEPASLEEAAPEGVSPPLQECVDTLLEKGFLVPADAAYQDDRPGADRRLAPSADTLFGCPRRAPGEKAADVSVVGVPFDLGTPTWAGAR